MEDKITEASLMELQLVQVRILILFKEILISIVKQIV